jgi:hypothetical protein
MENETDLTAAAANPAEETLGEKAKRLVDALKSRGYSASMISEALDNRVSPRTIYRWASGDSSPQQASNINAMKALVDRVVAEAAEGTPVGTVGK